jgi:hypothetical protein
MDEFLIHEEFIPKPKPPKAKGKLSSYLLSTVLAGLLITLTVLVKLVEIRFDIHEVDWFSFCFSLAISVSIILSSKYIGADLRCKIEKSGGVVKQARQDFESDAKSLDPAAFAVWVERQNALAKVEAYKAKNQASHEVIVEKLHGLMTTRYPIFDKWREKKIERLKKRLATIEERGTDEYISKNIYRLRVKYIKMRAVDFLAAVDAAGSRAERYTVSEGRENALGVTRGLLLTVLLSVVSVMFTFKVSFLSPNPVSIVYDLFMIVLNALLGYHVVGADSVATIVNVYLARRIVIGRYKKEKE